MGSKSQRESLRRPRRPAVGSVQIAASITCLDFSRLTRQFEDLEMAGVRRLHLDFADGRFVPNFHLGLEIFSLLPDRSKFVRECHLMIQDPLHLLHLFTGNADVVIFHWEAAGSPSECIEQIRSAGARPGVALGPHTPVSVLMPILKLIDLVVIMTVETGFSGGQFIPATVSKVGALRQAASAAGIALDIEVDGAINSRTIPDLARAGANVLVGGSSGLFTGRAISEEVSGMLASAHQR